MRVDHATVVMWGQQVGQFLSEKRVFQVTCNLMSQFSKDLPKFVMSRLLQCICVAFLMQYVVFLVLWHFA